MSQLETPKSPQERILAENNAIWIRRGLQASRLQARKADLDALPSMIPSYDAIASQTGTFSFDRSTGQAFQTTKETISFDSLLTERNSLHSKLLPALKTIQTLIPRFYKIDDRNKPTIDDDLSTFLGKTLDSYPYQYTLEELYDIPFDAYLQHAIRRLEQDKKFVPTDEQLHQQMRPREDTSAEFDGAITALKDAYGQLQAFQDRAKALHEAVLPKLQVYYRQCADRLATICTDASDGIINNAAQYFAPQNENMEAPNEMSRAFYDLRTVLVGLRCTDGRGGLSHALTVDAGYIPAFVQAALSKAGEERQILEKNVDKDLLQEFDVSLASAATEAPATEMDPPSSSETVQTAGDVPQRRSLVDKLLRRKR